MSTSNVDKLGLDDQLMINNRFHLGKVILYPFSPKSIRAVVYTWT